LCTSGSLQHLGCGVLCTRNRASRQDVKWQNAATVGTRTSHEAQAPEVSLQKAVCWCDTLAVNKHRPLTQQVHTQNSSTPNINTRVDTLLQPAEVQPCASTTRGLNDSRTNCCDPAWQMPCICTTAFTHQAAKIHAGPADPANNAERHSMHMKQREANSARVLLTTACNTVVSAHQKHAHSSVWRTKRTKVRGTWPIGILQRRELCVQKCFTQCQGVNMEWCTSDCTVQADIRGLSASPFTEASALASAMHACSRSVKHVLTRPSKSTVQAY
jgi:hypothetical protein